MKLYTSKEEKHAKSIGDEKKRIQHNGYELILYELSDELYKIETFEFGWVENIKLLNCENKAVSIQHPTGREFYKQGDGFDYFVDTEVKNGKFYVTSFGCIRYELNPETGEFTFNQQLK